MTYEPKMKNVIDAKATETDAMNSLRMSIIQKVLSNTAARMQLEEVPGCIQEAAEKAITADAITVSVGDIQTHFERLAFLAKWDRDEWFNEMTNLFSILVHENCWYEDKINRGFCWKNRKEEFCKLEIE